VKSLIILIKISINNFMINKMIFNKKTKKPAKAGFDEK
jgi:hypothetical protein